MSFSLGVGSLFMCRNHLRHIRPYGVRSVNTKSVFTEIQQTFFAKKSWKTADIKKCMKCRDIGANRFSIKGFKLNVPGSCSTKIVLVKSAAVLGLFVNFKHRNLIAKCEGLETREAEDTGDLIDRRVENTELEKEAVNFPWYHLYLELLPDIHVLVLAVFAAVAVAISNIQIPLMLGDLVNVVCAFAEQQSPEAANFLESVKKPVFRLLSVYACQAGMTLAYISLLSQVGERLAARLRVKLFRSVIQQDISFFDVTRTPQIIARLSNDVQEFKSSFKSCVSGGIRSITQMVGCSAAIYIVSPKLTLIVLLLLPSVVVVGALVGSLLREVSRRAQSQMAVSTSVADEAISNVRTVRAFAMEQQEVGLYAKEVDKTRRLYEDLGLGIGAFQACSNLVLNGVVLGVIVAGGSFVSRHEMSPGELMSFLVATQTIQRSLAQFSLLFGQAVRAVTAGTRVFQFSNLPPSITMSSLAKDGGKIASVSGDVGFQNVFFAYPSRPAHPVLQNFNLKIPAGKTVAICGLSGAGKSTVAALVERFYDVTKGEVTLDGHDLRTLDPDWLRGNAVGYINQEPVLFATSVRENIRYGRPSATDEQVYEAARLANAHDFISTFPDGYDTLVGERGTSVSGGQKQRIAIARALLKNPAILVLDEATSALDAESERLVQEALERVTSGRTVLIIAHRLSTIRNADQIVVLRKGRVVEFGTHKELSRKYGEYWQLIRQQENQDDSSNADENSHKAGGKDDDDFLLGWS